MSSPKEFNSRIAGLLFSQEAQRKSAKAQYMKNYWKNYSSKTVKCTLTVDELKALKKRAGELEIAPAQCLKRLALSSLEEERILPRAFEDQFGKIIFLLRNIGTNINQMARHCNRVEKMTLFDLVKAKTQIVLLETHFMEFLKKLQKSE